VVARRRARARPGPRLRRPGLGQRAKPSLRHLRLVNDEGWSRWRCRRHAEFAVEAIRKWWARWQRPFPWLRTAPDHRRRRWFQRLPATAWKYHLARFAAETGLDITCCHTHRDLEMEPHRAPHVQLHHHELARTAAHQPAHHYRADLGDSHTTGLTIQAPMTQPYQKA